MRLSLCVLTVSNRQKTTPPFSDSWQSNVQCKMQRRKCKPKWKEKLMVNEAPPSILAHDHTLVLTFRQSFDFCVILAAQNVAYLTSCCTEGNEIFIFLAVCFVDIDRKIAFRTVLVVNFKGRRPLGMPVLVNDFGTSPRKATID